MYIEIHIIGRYKAFSNKTYERTLVLDCINRYGLNREGYRALRDARAAIATYSPTTKILSNILGPVWDRGLALLETHDVPERSTNHHPKRLPGIPQLFSRKAHREMSNFRLSTVPKSANSARHVGSSNTGCDQAEFLTPGKDGNVSLNLSKKKSANGKGSNMSSLRGHATDGLRRHGGDGKKRSRAAVYSDEEEQDWTGGRHLRYPEPTGRKERKERRLTDSMGELGKASGEGVTELENGDREEDKITKAFQVHESRFPSATNGTHHVVLGPKPRLSCSPSFAFLESSPPSSPVSESSPGSVLLSCSLEPSSRSSAASQTSADVETDKERGARIHDDSTTFGIGRESKRKGRDFGADNGIEGGNMEDRTRATGAFQGRRGDQPNFVDERDDYTLTTAPLNGRQSVMTYRPGGPRGNKRLKDFRLLYFLKYMQEVDLRRPYLHYADLLELHEIAPDVMLELGLDRLIHAGVGMGQAARMIMVLKEDEKKTHASSCWLVTRRWERPGADSDS